MKIDSPLSSKEYLHHIWNHSGSFWDFGSERFTSVILGRFFWVTYHSGFEWDRKITNPKNRAWGFVKNTKEGCRVYGFRTMGFLDPLMFFLVLLLYSAVAAACIYFRFSELYWDDDSLRSVILTMALFVVVMSVIVAVSSAIMTSVSERGQLGRKYLLALLHDPDDPYNHINEY